MFKIVLVFGTRPEAIKMAPVILELYKYPLEFKTIVCVTGQHRQMLDQVLNLFDIKPDYDLDIMKPDRDLYDIFSQTLLKIRHVFGESKPDLVIVHGDTSTSIAAALAAFYKQIPVAHVEAGLRTNNIYNPWPEEMNRQLTSRISSYHYVPTRRAMSNLLKENIKRNNIIVTGNTVIDTLRLALHRIEESSLIKRDLNLEIIQKGYDIRRLTKSRSLILITGHRRENFGEGLENICKAILILSEKYPEFDFLYPVHLNPNVRRSVHKILKNQPTGNIYLTDPLDYLPFIYLMQRSYLIITDSGGIQEEAPFLSKPVLVLRDNTERPEALEAGTIKLIGTNCDRIVRYVSQLIDNPSEYQKMVNMKNPYGDGKAASRILKHLFKLKNSIKH